MVTVKAREQCRLEGKVKAVSDNTRVNIVPSRFQASIQVVFGCGLYACRDDRIGTMDMGSKQLVWFHTKRVSLWRFLLSDVDWRACPNLV